eukprot:CAMPEP_0198705040 /NCGR_PEP_ID=MMETSP1468-20131203/390222_1 /TAXON_ID=1461545 /ORGANISM="Mantoniella sp, Strain CCMP1436" /LENGTH=83 /DNA_ID=CAMNT_0044463889 /DNA_START=1156 /DNA_END=1404 /DNA_ORIENTATION=+
MFVRREDDVSIRVKTFEIAYGVKAEAGEHHGLGRQHVTQARVGAHPSVLIGHEHVPRVGADVRLRHIPEEAREPPHWRADVVG